MKAIKRNKDGVIMPYNPVMAQRTDVTVINDYRPGQTIDVQPVDATPKSAPKKRKPRKKVVKPDAPVVGDDADAVLAALTEDAGDGSDD